MSFRVSRRRAFVPGARGGDKSRDALRRTGRDAVSSPRATPRIKVAQQPASTRPAFVVARSAPIARRAGDVSWGLSPILSGNGNRGTGNGDAGWKKFRPRLSCTAPRPSATLRALPRGGRWCRHIPRSSQNCAGVTMKFAFGKCFMLPVTSFASPAIAVQ